MDKKKMRIATMVTGHYTTPPPFGVIYAPMDIAVAVSEGLARRGHEVTFFAPEGSDIRVSRVESGGLKPLRQKNGELEILKGPNVGGVEGAKIFTLWDQYLLSLMYKGALEGKFDILHIHPVDRALPFGYAIRNVPTVYTLHDPVNPWRAEVFHMFASPNQYYVSISDAQRKPAPDLNWLATIYNGIDIVDVPFSEKQGDYLLFVGRLHPEKGVAEAVEVARKTGEQLLILGPTVTGSYWEEKVKPYLGDQIRHISVVSRKELYEYYKNAKATLVPIRWEEPFGLVMIESMATGTPVIALRRGSVPEVIDHGKTGYIVESVGEMIDALKKIDSIDRRECRKRVEANFTTELMVDHYEKEFLRLIL
ncbi:MAG: glycosyltransferase family 4 protein [bacterium]|nr:glycosyltransferase family 4 protein [bacterium]